MTEHYYAIQIGTPRKHRPYLMLERHRNVPALFADKDLAEGQRPAGFNNKVVRVKITYGRQKK